MGAKAKTAGEARAQEAADRAAKLSELQESITTPYLTSSRDMMTTGRSASWMTPGFENVSQGIEGDREGALEAGLRGGQLNRFLAEQPFRRRMAVNSLMANLLQGGGGQSTANLQTSLMNAGNLGTNAGQLEMSRSMFPVQNTMSLFNSLFQGIGYVGGQWAGRPSSPPQQPRSSPASNIFGTG